MVCGALSDRFGRKKLLIVSGFLFAVSSIYTSNLSPTYIAEVSPAPSRGRLVSLNQLAIVVGILAVQIANWSIAEADGNPADDAPGDEDHELVRPVERHQCDLQLRRYVAGSWPGLRRSPRILPRVVSQYSTT